MCTCLYKPAHTSCPFLGLYSLSGRTSYRKISWILEAARFGFRPFQSLWNLTGTVFYYHFCIRLYIEEIFTGLMLTIREIRRIFNTLCTCIHTWLKHFCLAVNPFGTRLFCRNIIMFSHLISQAVPHNQLFLNIHSSVMMNHKMCLAALTLRQCSFISTMPIPCGWFFLDVQFYFDLLDPFVDIFLFYFRFFDAKYLSLTLVDIIHSLFQPATTREYRCYNY